MIDPRFHSVAREYARLKDEAAAGRITAEAFERALEGLTFEAGGRFWTLGANSGKWYMSDGEAWIEAQRLPTVEPVTEPANVTGPAPPSSSQQRQNVPAGPAPAPATGAPDSSSPKKVRPSQWILGCGVGCLAPLLILGGIGQLVWSLSSDSYGSTWIDRLAITFGVFVASVCAVPLLSRIPFFRFLLPAVLWAIIGLIMHTTGLGRDVFGFITVEVVWFTGCAAVLGVLLGLVVRKMVTPRAPG